MNKLKKILIIDDDRISTFLTKRIVDSSLLVECVQTFYQSEVALVSLKKTLFDVTDLPDLILLDINMPILDGWDFINELQKTSNYKPIPIVILSSSIYKEDQDKSESYIEIKGYLIKPLTLDKFNKIIQQIFTSASDAA